MTVDKKAPLWLLVASRVCLCSPDTVVTPVGSTEMVVAGRGEAVEEEDECEEDIGDNGAEWEGLWSEEQNSQVYGGPLRF